ncbi:MAG: hypothetical protein GYA60_09375 [Candidatus Methanofastidiosa archaeon]|nr:hypothetical protein [Candidatus Methanofastidiosa archaeon]
MIAAMVGRFSPLHLGHQMIIDTMIQESGIENCVIFIGSSNSLNSSTPYTYEERERMIHLLYPKMKIFPLPDVEPELEVFRDDTNDIWLENIKKIERKLGDKFIFYGGSKEDLEILALKFKTKIAIDRYTKGKGINATNIRSAINKKEFESVEKFLDKKIGDILLQRK